MIDLTKVDAPMFRLVKSYDLTRYMDSLMARHGYKPTPTLEPTRATIIAVDHVRGTITVEIDPKG